MSEEKTQIENGWECSAGNTNSGWYVAALIRTGCEWEFIENRKLPGERFPLLPGKTLEEWMERRPAAIGRELTLTTEEDSKTQQTLSKAERIFGPATPKETAPRPTVAWTEKRDGQWHLMLHQDGDTSSMFSDNSQLCNPAVALNDGNAFLACSRSGKDGREVIVFDQNGKILFNTHGMCPVLASTADGLALLCEQWDKQNDQYVLKLVLLDGSKVLKDLNLPPADDMNIHADMAYDAKAKRLYIVHETAPRWGFNEFIGGHREICAWMLEDNVDNIIPAPGTASGNMCLPKMAFVDWTWPGGKRSRELNQPPLQPCLIVSGDGPIMLFQQFRFRGQKSFGWDVKGTRLENDQWTPPVRLSEKIGLPDVSYGFTLSGNQAWCFQPCADQIPGRYLEEEIAGNSDAIAPNMLENNRIEIYPVNTSKGLEPTLFPADRKGNYIVYAPTDRPGAEPVKLKTPPENLKLVWGDIHSHSLYSKCMSPTDGSPEEVLRFQRDVLGCKVLSLTEHVHMMNENESTYHFDMLEAECGDECVPLYGTEPGAAPGHHTNFYTIDREVMERLRGILMTVRSRDLMHRAIKKHLPPNSVYVFRHYHGYVNGPYSVLDPDTVKTHDPELEFCMEAMQTRGNTMLGQGIQQEKHPHFPNNFLSAGAKLGLVGGTDHCGGVGYNHFGLTGFWTPELSPEAIWDCLRQRRTLACSNGKLAIWAEIDGHPLGDELSVEDRFSVKVELSSARKIRRVGLLHKQGDIDWHEINAEKASLEIESTDFFMPEPQWFCVTAEGESPLQDAPLIAHASPFFTSHPQ